MDIMQGTEPLITFNIFKYLKEGRKAPYFFSGAESI
jgi:hypothetical protein